MRETFIGYYDWSQGEFDVLWDKALFVFDTNTLLHIYRYKEKTCEMFLETLEAAQDRAWIPHHVAFEFHKNRRGCMRDQRNAYKKLTDKLKVMDDQFRSVLNDFKIHKLIDREELLGKFKEGTAAVGEVIKEIEAKHPDYSENDPVLPRVAAVFQERLGKELSDDELEAIYEEGVQRYAEKIPPGYKDDSKDMGKSAKFGDLIIWKEMIAKAKEDNVPIIFVTNDNKEDWWLDDGGKTIGPRPELIQEFKKESGQICYIYQPMGFIERAREYFVLEAAKPEILSEIEEVREEREVDLTLGDTLLRYHSLLNKQHFPDHTDALSSYKHYSAMDPDSRRYILDRDNDNTVEFWEHEGGTSLIEEAIERDCSFNVASRQREFKNRVEKLRKRLFRLEEELLDVEEFIERYETGKYPSDSRTTRLLFERRERKDSLVHAIMKVKRELREIEILGPPI